MLDSLYNYEIHQNIAVQKWAGTWGLQNLFVSISKITQFENLLLYIAVIALYKHTVLRRTMVLLCVSIYTTFCLKWILPEIRPKWMSQVKLIYGAEYCDSSAGFPSGHLVIVTAMLCVLLRYTVKSLSKNNEYMAEKTVKILSSIFSLAVLSLVTLSQMSLGSHFLHQCIAGIVVGYVIAYVLLKKSVNHYYKELPIEQAVGVAVGMTLVVVLIYYAKIGLKMDPNWGFNTASEKCRAPGKMNIRDSAIYGFCCAIGILFGLALSSPLKECGVGMDSKLGSVPIFLVAGVKAMVTEMIPRTYGDSVFYGLVILLCLVYTVLIVSLIPKVLYLLLDSEGAAAADTNAKNELAFDVLVENDNTYMALLELLSLPEAESEAAAAQ